LALGEGGLICPVALALVVDGDRQGGRLGDRQCAVGVGNLVVVGCPTSGDDRVIAGRGRGTCLRRERDAAHDILGDIAVVRGAGDGVRQCRISRPVDLALVVGGDRPTTPLP